MAGRNAYPELASFEAIGECNRLLSLCVLVAAHCFDIYIRLNNVN